MATIKLTPLQKEMLESFRYTRRLIGRYSATINVLLEAGFVFRSWYEYDFSEYAITPAGLAYLYQDAPMVDQPQPPSEIEPQSFKVGDLVYYVNAHNHTCTATVMNVTSDVVTILTSAGGKLERPASDLQMVTGSYNDDLPFTVIGNDPADTQELLTVKVEAEMSLSQLVDAALDPDNQDAFETLKAYDLTNVPLWILEIERNDLADLKWALWSECRKINAGTLMSNPDYVAKQIEVNRAFQVCDILHKEVVNRKAVGFNVLE